MTLISFWCSIELRVRRAISFIEQHRALCFGAVFLFAAFHFVFNVSFEKALQKFVYV
jgi:hypothetical protein